MGGARFTAAVACILLVERAASKEPEQYTAFIFPPLSRSVSPILNCDDLVFDAGCDCNTVIDAVEFRIHDKWESGRGLGEIILECHDCAAAGNTFTVLAPGVHARVERAGGTIAELLRDVALITLKPSTYGRNSGALGVITFGRPQWVPETLSSFMLYNIRIGGMSPSWSEAQMFCENELHFMQPGHLATLVREADKAVTELFEMASPAHAWVGGTSVSSDDVFNEMKTWRWVTGPSCPMRVCDIMPRQASPGRWVCDGVGCGTAGLDFARTDATFPATTVAFPGSYEAFPSSQPTHSAASFLAVDLSTGEWVDFLHSSPIGVAGPDYVVCEYPSTNALCLPFPAIEIVFERTVLDECDASCSGFSCAACLPTQTCTDPVPYADWLLDWECTCTGQKGAAIIGLPSPADLCESYDECSPYLLCEHCEHFRCGPTVCVDPNPAVRDDWFCVCTTDQGAKPVAQERIPQLCDWDECTGGAPGAATCGAMGQGCIDPTPIYDPYGAFPVVDTIAAAGVKLMVGMGPCTASNDCAVGLTCVFPEGGRITAPSLGLATSGPVGHSVCVMDVPYPGLKLAGSPGLTNMNLGDGPCGDDSSCVKDLKCWKRLQGVSRKTVAPFIGQISDRRNHDGVNYCYAHGIVLPAQAARLRDIGEGPCDTDADCRPGLVCFLRSGPDFRYVPGVLLHPAEFDADTNLCYKPTPVVAPPPSLNDWSCACRDPAVGALALGTPAHCLLDECATPASTCPSCALDACANESGILRACTDPNHDPLSVGDWVCTCLNDGDIGVGYAPPCGNAVNECIATCATCRVSETCPHGPPDYYTCSDPTTDTLGDWLCRCPDGTTDTARPPQCASTAPSAPRDSSSGWTAVQVDDEPLSPVDGDTPDPQPAASDAPTDASNEAPIGTQTWQTRAPCTPCTPPSPSPARPGREEIASPPPGMNASLAWNASLSPTMAPAPQGTRVVLFVAVGIGALAVTSAAIAVGASMCYSKRIDDVAPPVSPDPTYPANIATLGQPNSCLSDSVTQNPLLDIFEGEPSVSTPTPAPALAPSVERSPAPQGGAENAAVPEPPSPVSVSVSVSG
eukprot:TRINITY_DN20226_c0_g1_i1.p1 TRINITY_DN20226_c0_g1~~TRINITY_DN20226_c0_g1_i1.p1  ORF type:complete len:1079 (+),score=35.20 TRINITY_DN20226_c0_g1_i1:85-3321(+)